MREGIKHRWGIKGKSQLPLLMVWDEHWHGGEVVHADVIFSTSDFRYWWGWRRLFRNLVAI